MHTEAIIETVLVALVFEMMDKSHDEMRYKSNEKRLSWLLERVVSGYQKNEPSNSYWFEILA